MLLQAIQTLEAGDGSIVGVNRALLLFSIKRDLLTAATALPQPQRPPLEALNAGAVVEPAPLPASLWYAIPLVDDNTKQRCDP